MELSKENQEWLLDISKTVHEFAGVKVISMNQHDLEIKLMQDQQKIEELEKELKESNEVVKAVAHIGIDWGFGKYELEDKFITLAREIYENDNSLQEPTLNIKDNKQ